MSEPERPFLPMSGELGGDFMSGMADSIRERGAREVPAPTEEGVEETFDDFEEWEEEWEEEEPLSVSEKLMMLIKRATVPLVEFAIDTATLVTVPTALLLLAYHTVTDILEVALLLFGATIATLMITNIKQKLLRRLRPS
jgi:hypothetical protein